MDTNINTSTNIAKQQPPDGKTTQFDPLTGKYTKQDPMPGGFTLMTDPYTESPTDAWPINPSGSSNPLPPDGGATGATQS